MNIIYVAPTYVGTNDSLWDASLTERLMRLNCTGPCYIPKKFLRHVDLGKLIEDLECDNIQAMCDISSFEEDEDLIQSVSSLAANNPDFIWFMTATWFGSKIPSEDGNWKSVEVYDLEDHTKHTLYVYVQQPATQTFYSKYLTWKGAQGKEVPFDVVSESSERLYELCRMAEKEIWSRGCVPGGLTPTPYTAALRQVINNAGSHVLCMYDVSELDLLEVVANLDGLHEGIAYSTEFDPQELADIPNITWIEFSGAYLISKRGLHSDVVIEYVSNM